MNKDRKEYLKKWREEHKEYIAEYKKEYVKNNGCSYKRLQMKYKNLKKQLEEKDKVIDQAIDYIKNTTLSCEDEDIHLNELFDTSNLLEILERGKK